MMPPHDTCFSTTHLWDQPSVTYMCGEILPWRMEHQSCVSKGDLCNYSMVTCPQCKELWDYIEGVIEHGECMQCKQWSDKLKKALLELKSKLKP